MYGLLVQLTESWTDSNQGGGHFSVEQDDGVFHIVPTEVRDADGNWRAVSSILTTPISLPSQPRTERETLKAIGNAITAASGVKIATDLNSGFILGAHETTQYTIGAQDELAFNVLNRAIQVMGRNLSWYLWYDPISRDYLFDVYNVPESTPNSSAPKPVVAAPASATSDSCGPTAAVCPPR